MHKIILHIYVITCMMQIFASPTLNPVRRLLCHIRGGDYLHPGDERAVDQIITQALLFDPTLTSRSALDVGCGFGGSTHYLAQKGFKTIQGIDIDEAAIVYAQKTYPDCTFMVANALGLDTLLAPDSYGFIMMLSVIYAIQDKRSLLTTLHAIAQPDALLVIFDYTQTTDDLTLKDATHSLMHAIIPADLRIQLQETGWQIVFEQDMSDYFLQEYNMLLKKLHNSRAALETLFTRDVIARVEDVYRPIQKRLASKELGGILLIARKVENT